MKNKSVTYKIVIIGMFSAIFVILDRFVKFEMLSFKITLSALPIIIVALLYGPVEGMLVGLVGSFVSQALSEYGLSITTPLWMLPALIRGLIVGLSKNMNTKKQCLFIVISSIVVTLINTGVMIIDSKIFGYDSDAMNMLILLTRVASGLICAIIYCLIAPRVVKALKGKVSKNG